MNNGRRGQRKPSARLAIADKTMGKQAVNAKVRRQTNVCLCIASFAQSCSTAKFAATMQNSKNYVKQQVFCKVGQKRCEEIVGVK
jgi:hypothetical protein